MEVCSSCNVKLTDCSDVIHCVGPCNKFFHNRCTDLSQGRPSLHDFCRRRRIWKCLACRNRSEKIRNRILSISYPLTKTKYQTSNEESEEEDDEDKEGEGLETLLENEKRFSVERLSAILDFKKQSQKSHTSVESFNVKLNKIFNNEKQNNEINVGCSTSMIVENCQLKCDVVILKNLVESLWEECERRMKGVEGKSGKSGVKKKRKKESPKRFLRVRPDLMPVKVESQKECVDTLQICYSIQIFGKCWSLTYSFAPYMAMMYEKWVRLGCWRKSDDVNNK
ncbi:hypothetical protein LSTR_LSTR007935 [Laodelphax striatellus]|uniref:PHD-type domain-containing protein n=1 Tax=Laodelphax striatellus TaxID=195883 RepID=A0A482XSI0_LAOST|nr:hypothetical protein LSTR_LSTR007935 [Laodelphax striatellus]